MGLGNRGGSTAVQGTATPGRVALVVAAVMTVSCATSTAPHSDPARTDPTTPTEVDPAPPDPTTPQGLVQAALPASLQVGPAHLASRPLFEHQLDATLGRLLADYEPEQAGDWLGDLQGDATAFAPIVLYELAEQRDDPDLAFEHHPVQQEGGLRILVHFPGLAASIVRVEYEPVHGKALEKDHARRRNAVPIGCREGSRLRKEDARLFGLFEPFTEQFYRIPVDRRLGQPLRDPLAQRNHGLDS